MTQTLELLLDEDAERAVVADWAALARAGLPSQARHQGASNRPHVTVASLPDDGPVPEEAWARACRASLPLPGYAGGLLVLGEDPVAVARLVVGGPALAALHADVAAAAGVHEGRGAPGRWVPHVTLARRVPREQVGAVLAALSPGERPLRLVAARRWDSRRREVRPVA